MYLAVLLFAVFITICAGYTGEASVYHLGNGDTIGICGYLATDQDDVVAISAGMMNNVAGAVPSDNPICGSSVSIFNPVSKETWFAIITDVCSRCGYHDIAFSPKLMLQVGKFYDWHTKIQGIDWGGPIVGG